jgi:hypothetical protein
MGPEWDQNGTWDHWVSINRSQLDFPQFGP